LLRGREVRSRDWKRKGLLGAGRSKREDEGGISGDGTGGDGRAGGWIVDLFIERNRKSESALEALGKLKVVTFDG
jgi:hypothetical protein